MIDISQPTPYEIEAGGGFGSVKHLLDTISQIESRRRDQDILDRYIKGIASIQATRGNVTPQDQANILTDLSQPKYDTGLAGIFQRIGGSMPNAQSTVLPQLQANLINQLSPQGQSFRGDPLDMRLRKEYQSLLELKGRAGGSTELEKSVDSMIQSHPLHKELDSYVQEAVQKSDNEANLAGLSASKHLQGYPEKQKRTFLDDVVSEEDVIKGLGNFVDEQVGFGRSRDDAINQAIQEYNDMMNSDTGKILQKYPKLDREHLRQKLSGTGTSALQDPLGIR